MSQLRILFVTEALFMIRLGLQLITVLLHTRLSQIILITGVFYAAMMWWAISSSSRIRQPLSALPRQLISTILIVMIRGKHGPPLIILLDSSPHLIWTSTVLVQGLALHSHIPRIPDASSFPLTQRTGIAILKAPNPHGWFIRMTMDTLGIVGKRSMMVVF